MEPIMCYLVDPAYAKLTTLLVDHSAGLRLTP
jgi:hypothetical protein